MIYLLYIVNFQRYTRLSEGNLFLKDFTIGLPAQKINASNNIEIILLNISAWEKIPLDFLTFPAAEIFV